MPQKGIFENTYYTWKKKFSGLGVSKLSRLRQLEEEDRKLKQLIADLSLYKAMLQDGRLEIVQGRVNRPDAVIESDTGYLKALAFGGRSLDEALEAGALTMTGDKASAQRFFKLFRLPEPVIAVRSA